MKENRTILRGDCFHGEGGVDCRVRDTQVENTQDDVNVQVGLRLSFGQFSIFRPNELNPLKHSQLYNMVQYGH